MGDYALQTEISYVSSHPDYPIIHIDYMVRPAGFKLDYHQHEFYQFIVVTCGSLNVYNDNNTFVVREGCVMIIPPAYNHMLTSVNGYSQCGIDMVYDNNTPPYSLIDKFKTPTILNIPEILKFTTVLSNSLFQSDCLAYEAQNLAAKLIICQIINQSELDMSKLNSTRLTEYINTHISDNITLTDIADGLYTSISSLQRICHRYFGMSVKALLNIKRYEYACMLLTSTEKSISDIAVMVGFDNVSNFSLFFKKYSKQSPTEYRNNIIKLL